MLPKAYIGHKVDTRTRFYLPYERNRPELFSRIETQLSHCKGVKGVKINAVTRSVLVFHSCILNDLIYCAKENALFEIDPNLGERKSWAEDVVERINRADKKIVDTTDGEFNLTTLLALGFLGAGTYQFSRKQFFPAASSLFSDAMRMLILANRRAAVKAKRKPSLVGR